MESPSIPALSPAAGLFYLPAMRLKDENSTSTKGKAGLVPAQAALRWSTGKLGCLFPLVAGAAILFSVGAVDPGALGTTGRHRATIEMLQQITVSGVNVPFLLIALFLFWELGRMGWRWADEVAVTARADGLHFHPTLLRRPLPWDEVAEVRLTRRKRGFAEVPMLLIVSRGGSILIGGIEGEGGAAERFAALAEQARAERSLRGGERVLR